jgi:hypothetical protein
MRPTCWNCLKPIALPLEVELDNGRKCKRYSEKCMARYSKEGEFDCRISKFERVTFAAQEKKLEEELRSERDGKECTSDKLTDEDYKWFNDWKKKDEKKEPNIDQPSSS